MRRMYYNKNRTVRYYSLTCKTHHEGVIYCANTSTMNGSKFETLIIEQINNWISDYCEHDEIRIQSEHEIKLTRLDFESKTLYTAIEKANKTINTLYEDKINKIISEERFIMLSDKYEDEIAVLRSKLKNIEQQSESIRGKGMNDEYRKKLIEKHTFITELTHPIADEFIDVVYIGEKIFGQEREITVHWKF